MKILILGGSGFIGEIVSQRLITNGHNVSTIVHKNLPKYLRETEIEDKSKLKIIHGNIFVKNSLKYAFENQDIIVNLVGQISEDKNLFYDLNIIGGLNVLEMCKDSNIKNIILISSSMVYGESRQKPSKESDTPNPMTNYSLTKLLTETVYIHFTKKFGFNLSILRLSNVYGPDKKSGIIHNIISSMNKNKEVIIHNDGNQIRDYIYINDAVDGIIKVIENLPKGIDTFNISTSTKTNILEIISTIEEQSSKKLMLKFVQDETYNEQCTWADNTKAKRYFDFCPKINLNQGIGKTIANTKSLKYVGLSK